MKLISQLSRFESSLLVAVALLMSPSLVLAQSDSEKRSARKVSTNTLVVPV
ncbi:MAG: hypothetical protein ACKO0Z_23835 [Betaproteobacteria bacterium]